MEYHERRKKSDKAKDKAGQPSKRHVRAYEAIMEKRQQQVSSASLAHRHEERIR